MKKILITAAIVFYLSAQAEPINEIKKLQTSYSQYKDPAKRVAPTELGELSSSEAKTVLLETHRLINKFRQENGKSPLVIHPEISWWSQQHSEWMAAGRYGLSHIGAQERYRELVKVLPRVRTGGENCAYIGPMHSPASTVVKGWMHSPGHRANMLGDFNLTGFGLARSRDGTWWFTQFFIKSLEEEFVNRTAEESRNQEPTSINEDEESVAEEETVEKEAEDIDNDKDNNSDNSEKEPKELVDINDPEVSKQLHHLPLLYYRYLIHQELNKKRRKNGFKDLIEHPIPDYYAQRHSDSMGAGNYPLGKSDISSRQQTINTYIPGTDQYTEFYAAIPISDPNPPRAAVEKWLSDPRGKILTTSPINVFGSGISKGFDDRYYFTLIVMHSNHPSFNR